MKNAMKSTALLVALCCAIPAHADEASKKIKIEKLVEAQGLKQMFDEQLNQIKASTAAMGKDTFAKLSKENGGAAQDPKLQKVLQKFLERSSAIFSSKDMLDVWSKAYGKDLSEADLEQITAYYLSPVGKKDVRAEQGATVIFTQQVLAQTEKRVTALLEQFEKDLVAASKK